MNNIILRFLTQFSGQGITAAKNALNALYEGAKKAGSGIKKIFSQLGGEFGELGNTITNFLQGGIWAAGIGLVQSYFKQMREKAEKEVEKLKESVKSLAESINNYLMKSLNTVADKFNSIIKAAKEVYDYAKLSLTGKDREITSTSNQEQYNANMKMLEDLSKAQSTQQENLIRAENQLEIAIIKQKEAREKATNNVDKANAAYTLAETNLNAASQKLTEATENERYIKEEICVEEGKSKEQIIADRKALQEAVKIRKQAEEDLRKAKYDLAVAEENQRQAIENQSQTERESTLAVENAKYSLSKAVKAQEDAIAQEEQKKADAIQKETELQNKIIEEKRVAAQKEIEARDKLFQKLQQEALQKDLQNAQNQLQQANNDVNKAQNKVQNAWANFRDPNRIQQVIDEEKANNKAQKLFNNRFNDLQKMRDDWRTATNLSKRQRATRDYALALEEEAAAKERLKKAQQAVIDIKQILENNMGL